MKFFSILFLCCYHFISLFADEVASLNIPEITITKKISDQDIKRTYMNYVLETIQDHKFYPKLARDEHLEGKCLLKFEILKDGTIQNAFIEAPSTHFILNQAALDLLEKIGKFRPIPQSFNENSIAVKVSLDYTVKLN